MSVFETIIGWVAPPDCLSCGLEGSGLCEACSASEIIPFGERCFNCGKISRRCRTCVSCRKSGTPRAVWVATGYSGLAKELLQKYKFGHSRAISSDMAKLMVETYRSYNESGDISHTNHLVIHIPTATIRVRERSFDHAQLLAKEVAAELNLDCSQGLSRLGQGRQVGARRSTRLIHKDHSYYVHGPDQIKGRSILLIDDVVTTGATLQAATKALREAGATHVDALVFAKRL